MTDPYSTPDRPRASAGFDLNKPSIVAICYLLGALTGVFGLIGLILAYLWKQDVEEAWMVSHMRFHIRTFWYSFAFMVGGVVTAIIGIGFLILAFVSLYFFVRSVLALVEAQKARPIPDPTVLFW